MMSPRRRAYLTAVLPLLALAPDARAQAQLPNPHFQRFAHERGLSNPTVTGLMQDRHGFLWIGTQDGLNRYDGASFTVLRPVPGDTTSLATAWIATLAPSRSGAVWVGLLGAGIHRLDAAGGRPRRYRHNPADSSTLSTDQVTTILEAQDGTLWVGTGNGLNAVDTATGRVRRYRPDLRTDSTKFTQDVLSLLEGPDGELWVGTRLGVYLFDRRTERFRELPVSVLTREVRSMALDSSGVAWVAFYDDLVAVDAKSLRVLRQYRRRASSTHPLLANGINAMALADSATLWIGTNDGLIRLNPATTEFTRHRSDARDPGALSGPIVRSLLVDRGGVLWAGLESHGLHKYAPSAVTFGVLGPDAARAEGALSDGYIRGITEDRRGNLWVATQNGGLNRIDAHSRRVAAYRHRPRDSRSLPGDNVWAFLEDRSGVHWVGLHTRGLGTLDPATGTFRRHSALPENASVNVLHEDSRGALWVGTEGIGLVVLSPDRKSARTYGYSFGERRILAGNDVQAILEDVDGRFWIGGADGLTRLDPATDEVTHFAADPSRPGALPSIFVTDLHRDSHGTLWVATKGGGISRFDAATGTFTSFGPAQRMPHSFIYGILEDAAGRLWLSSDDGIAMFDPVSGVVIRYGLEDGLQAREFNRRARYRAADGTMYFGGINGLNVFHPGAIASSLLPPPTVKFVTVDAGDMHRSGVALTADSVVRLRHDASSVTITFASLDFTAPEKIQFAYRLDGVDRDWVMAGSRNQATYAGLSPGRRVFRVRAASPAGVWSSDAAVSLLVRPAWWATWWAYALEALGLAALVAVVIRLRLRAARLRSLELERRVEEQTRDLVTTHQQLSESLARQRDAAEKLSHITAAVPGALFQLVEGADAIRRFDFVSPGIMALCGDLPATPTDPDAAMDALLSRVDPADRPLLDGALLRSRDTLDAWRVELRWAPRANSEPRWLSIQAHAARHADGSTVWTGLVTDATDARRAEEERMALESRVLQAQKEESLAILAGGVAHDFNNVLVSVVMGAELLEQRVTEEFQVDLVRRIRSAGRRASELTQQMLAYTGKGQITVESVDVTAIARDMLSLLRTAVPRTIELDFQADARSAIVEADATQLRQIVLNLVTNASEAIGDRPGRVLVRVDVVTGARHEFQLLHASPGMPDRGAWVLLEVTDDGAGMDPALLERIFDPFFTTKFTGRGLGLAALLGIVRAHRGGVKVITALRSGTRFQIYIPRAPSDAAAAMADGRTAPAARASARKRLLVVDDEREVAEMTQLVLEDLGYEVLLAGDGEEAVSMAMRPGLDAILLDVMMPKLNGAAAARTMRARGVRTPIVLMSGYAEDELVTRGLKADANAFLKKPFLAPELARVISEAVRPATGGARRP